MEPLTFIIYILGYIVAFAAGWLDLKKIYRCTKSRLIFLLLFSLGSWVSVLAVGISMLGHAIWRKG